MKKAYLSPAPKQSALADDSPVSNRGCSVLNLQMPKCSVQLKRFKDFSSCYHP
jgi:hypothetical protein